MPNSAHRFHPNERVALFIDGPNFFHSARVHNLDVDYVRLQEVVTVDDAHLLRAAYYTPVVRDDECSLRPLLDYLSFHGYAVLTRAVREFPPTGGDIAKRIKGSIVPDLCCDALMLAASGRVDHVILASGDGEFVPLVRALSSLGLRTTILSTVKSRPSMCSDELRKCADAFVEVLDIAHSIRRSCGRDSS